MEFLNPVLFLVLVAEICLGFAAWRSPRFLRRMAAHLLTRADVVEVSRQETERRMKHYLDELGVNADPVSVPASHRVALHGFAHDEVEVS
jgi:hypothetical protein